MITKIFAEGPIPQISYEGDAGIDLKYNGKESIIVIHNVLYKIHTGLYVEIPKGKCGIIFERSGLGSRGVSIHGRIIDSGYRGEIIVLLSQRCSVSYDSSKKEEEILQDLVIDPGDKVAQMVIMDVYPQWEQIASRDVLSPSIRGEKGLGSTGN